MRTFKINLRREPLRVGGPTAQWYSAYSTGNFNGLKVLTYKYIHSLERAYHPSPFPPIGKSGHHDPAIDVHPTDTNISFSPTSLLLFYSIHGCNTLTTPHSLVNELLFLLSACYEPFICLNAQQQ